MKPGPNYTRGDTKRCNGPLHKGEYIPLECFWYFKKGIRAGKPMSRCKDCLRYQYAKPTGGYIPIARVRFIYEELERRVGRAEAARRIGASQNFYIRFHRNQHKFIQKPRVKKAMEVLREMRANDEVRHRDSIRHGASARGRKEREVTENRHLYKPHGDHDTEVRRKHRP